MTKCSLTQSRYSLKTALEWRIADPEKIENFQTGLLRSQVQQASQAPYYKQLLRELGCSFEDIITLEDLRSLPFTSRSALETDPAAFQAVEAASIADLSLTSGTTGSPIVVPYTRSDLERLAFNELMAFWGTGVRPGDRYLICVTLDRCFIAGLAYFSGLVQLGATAIRSGPGQSARQWELISRLKPNGIVGVPTFLLKLAQWGKAQGYSPNSSGVQSLVTIGEPVRGPDHSLIPLGKDLEEAWGARVYSSYAATELETCFCECHASCGGHIHPELALVEIVDEDGNVLPTGKAGEVVVTPLGVEGFPLIRFRTGDVARLHTDPCPCGWRTTRLGPIEGRLAQRLKFHGTTIYPEMIFQALRGLKNVEEAYVEVRSSYDLSDEIKVVAGTDASDIDADMVAELLQARLRVRPEVIVRPRQEVLSTMEKAGGRKLKRFFDFRDNNRP